MEASKPEECREDRPRVRLLAWIALAVAVVSLGISIITSAGLYADLDMSSVEVPGPHPILGWLGAQALFAGSLVILPSMGLAALALLLAPFRRPRLRNVAVALFALLLITSAWVIYGAALHRIRSNPFRHRAGAASVLRPVIRKYVDEHGGALPPAATWCNALISVDPNAADYFTRVIERDEPNGLSWLALNANLDGDMLAALPDEMVLLFEMDPAVNPVGNAEVLASYARDKRAVVVVFGDLHVELVRPRDLQHLRWAPAP